MNTRRLAAVLGFLGVALGAFGAHSLPKFVPAERLAEATDWWRTGALYHLIHAVALLATRGREAGVGAGVGVGRIGWSFALGIVLFSGSLYSMALGAPRVLGAVTPLGGLLFLVGWLLLALGRE